jgi:serine/threonine-protein kinase ULK2
MSKTVGDYVLKEKLGKGNFADVYLGVHKTTKEKFAVKVISKESFIEPKLLAGLESEIKIMKELKHPHLLQLVKYFTSEKNFYIVTEYCPGGDLSKFIRKRGALPEALAFNFLHQLTQGLYFLNEHEFIHRDLKPANVLLTVQSEHAILKIADFGFARSLGESILAQTRCGTPLYMVGNYRTATTYVLILFCLWFFSAGTRNTGSQRLRCKSGCLVCWLHIF